MMLDGQSVKIMPAQSTSTPTSIMRVSYGRKAIPYARFQRCWICRSEPSGAISMGPDALKASLIGRW